MTRRASLDDFHARQVAQARELWADAPLRAASPEDAPFPPTLVVQVRDRRLGWVDKAFPVIGDAGQRRALVFSIGAALFDQRVRLGAASLIAEAWRSPADAVRVAPSVHPAREGIVVVFTSGPDGRAVASVLPVVEQAGGGRRLGAPTTKRDDDVHMGIVRALFEGYRRKQARLN